MTQQRTPSHRSPSGLSRSTARAVVRNKRKIPRQATSSVAYELVPPAPDDLLLDFMPVPHVAARSNSIKPDVQRAFIAQLAATGIVNQAARHVGKSIEALYKLRQKPGAEGFRAAWDAALDLGGEPARGLRARPPIADEEAWERERVRELMWLQQRDAELDPARAARRQSFSDR